MNGPPAGPRSARLRSNGARSRSRRSRMAVSEQRRAGSRPQLDEPADLRLEPGRGDAGPGRGDVGPVVMAALLQATIFGRPVKPARKSGPSAGSVAAGRPRASALYFPAMHVTTTPAPNSTVVLEIELPPERLDRPSAESVRHLSRRTRVPGFRPGKAPRPVLERALGPARDPRRRRRAPDRGRLSRRPHPGGHRPPRQCRRRDRPGRGRQAVRLQGDRPGPAGGHARRLPELQLRAGDRADRRRPGRQGHRGAARPERDPRRRSRTAARRKATTRSSASSAPATASRSTAAPRIGCRSSSARSA